MGDAAQKRRVYQCPYFVRECFPLELCGVCERMARLRHVAGFVAGRPSDFLCLFVRFTDLRPPAGVVAFLLASRAYKYLTFAALLYTRVERDSLEAYRTLEPFLNDCRVLNVAAGGAEAGARAEAAYTQLSVDEAVDALLTEKSFLGIALKTLAPRRVFESSGALAPLHSVLEV